MPCTPKSRTCTSLPWVNPATPTITTGQRPDNDLKPPIPGRAPARFRGQVNVGRVGSDGVSRSRARGGTACRTLGVSAAPTVARPETRIRPAYAGRILVTQLKSRSVQVVAQHLRARRV